MAQNSSGASTEPLLPSCSMLHPLSSVLPAPLGCRSLIVCLLCVLGMNCSLLFQKIEILDDEESDLISNSEVDQMSSLLDYKVSDWVKDSGIIPREFRGWICQEFSKGFWDPEFICCFPGVHIMPSSHLQPLYPYFNPNGGRKAPFLQSCSSLHVSQQRDFWSHSTRIVPWSAATLFLQHGAASSGRE